MEFLDAEAQDEDEGERTEGDEADADADCNSSDAGTSKRCSSDSSEGNSQSFDPGRNVHGVPCSYAGCHDPTMLAGAATTNPLRCNVNTGQRPRRNDVTPGMTRQYFCTKVVHAEGKCKEKAKWVIKDGVVACQSHAKYASNGANVSAEAVASLRRRMAQSALFLAEIKSSALSSEQRRPRPSAAPPVQEAYRERHVSGISQIAPSC